MQGIREVISLHDSQEILNGGDQVSKTGISFTGEIAEGEIINQNRRAMKTLARRSKSVDSYLKQQGDDTPHRLECKDYQANRVQNLRAENRIHLLEEALTAVGVEIPIVPIEEALEIQQSSSSATQMLDNGKKLLKDLEERHRRQLQSAEEKHNKELRRVYDRYEASRKEEIASLDQRLETALYRNKYLEDQREIHRENIQALRVEKARLESVLHLGAQHAAHLQQHRNELPQPVPVLGSQGPPPVPGAPPYGHILPGPWPQPVMPHFQVPMVPHHLLGTELGQVLPVYPPLLANANQALNVGTYVPPDSMSHNRHLPSQNATQTILPYNPIRAQAQSEAAMLRRERGNFQGEISRLAQLLAEEKDKYLYLQNHLERVEQDMDMEKNKFSVDRKEQFTAIQKFQQENQKLRLKIAELEAEIHNPNHGSEELIPTNKALEKGLGIISSKSPNLNLKQDVAALEEGANVKVDSCIWNH